jgi:predicted aconitase with swiveling domain
MRTALVWIALALHAATPAVARAAPASSDSAARLAVITDSTSDDAASIAALVEVSLSGQPGLHLLERRAIAQLLGEQKLSMSGLVDARTAIRLGKILAVDGLVTLLPGEKGQAVQAVVVFDARSGLRLADVSVSVAEAQQAVQTIVAAVLPAVKKLNSVSTAGGHTVGVMPVNNADLPRTALPVCQGVRRLVEQALTNTQGLAVVERQQLDHVNRERAISTMAGENRLLSSLALLEVELSRGKAGKGCRFTVVLSDVKGTILEKAEGEAALDAAEISRCVMGRAAEWLQVALPTTGADRQLESRRFAREAEFLYQVPDHEAAVAAAEAAYALDPSAGHLDTLIRTEEAYAGGLIDPDTFDAAVARMTCAVELRLQKFGGRDIAALLRAGRFFRDRNPFYLDVSGYDRRGPYGRLIAVYRAEDVPDRLQWPAERPVACVGTSGHEFRQVYRIQSSDEPPAAEFTRRHWEKLSPVQAFPTSNRQDLAPLLPGNENRPATQSFLLMQRVGPGRQLLLGAQDKLWLLDL